MKHRYKSIEGAVRRIRQLEKLVQTLRGLANHFQTDRNLMAKLATDEPAFVGPVERMSAIQRRDAILKELWTGPR